MTEFNDFRVLVTPNLQTPGHWDVELLDCPVDELAGAKGSVQPIITPQELQQLRRRDLWPDLGTLKSIGQRVWQSLMTAELNAAFMTCLAASKKATPKRGMRLIVSLVGEEAQLPPPGTIRLQEFPVEALYLNSLNFIAPNPMTPVSRSLTFKPDIEAEQVTLPLRILVVVAAPQDKPHADIQAEKNVLKKALKKLIATGGVELEFCDPPTRNALAAELQKNRYHILHFIGHGAFAIVGDDPTPRPHLCLEDDDKQSDAVDAETFEIMLQNSGVRLVVMTACASAQPAPEEVQGIVGPFNGLAQRLIAGISGVSAVVAMQFDLESKAAVAFSRTCYTQLLVSGNKLDEVIASCRKALATEMNVGHRAWITPVLLWRCKDAKVFDIDPLKDTLPANIQQRIIDINNIVSIYKKHINDVSNPALTPLDAQPHLAPLVLSWQKQIDQLEEEKSESLGNIVRLRGGYVKVTETILCRLTLRLRTPMIITNVTVQVRFSSAQITFIQSLAGEKTAGLVPLTGAATADSLQFLLSNVSQNEQWGPGEYEIARLKFQLNAGVTMPIIEIGLENAQVQNDEDLHAFRMQNAVLFVSK